MLSIYFSIFVMGMVTAAFLLVCYVTLCGIPHFGRSEERAEEPKVVLSEEAILKAAHAAAAEEESPVLKDEIPAEAANAAAEPAHSLAEEETDALEETKIFSPVAAETAAEEEEGATRIFTKADVETVKEARSPAAALPFPPEPAPQILSGSEDENTLETYFVRHFLNQYGAVSRTVAEDTETVTHELIGRLTELTGDETVAILQRLMV